MPYEVIANEPVTILKSYGALKHPVTGDIYSYDEESVLWRPGDVIPDEEISPTVVELYENGDEHVRARIKKLSAGKAKKLAKEEQEAIELEDKKEEGDYIHVPAPEEGEKIHESVPPPQPTPSKSTKGK